MKATGSIRPVDQLGRVVIPKSIRDTYQMKTGTPMEIFTDEKGILIRPYFIKCVCCGAEDVELVKVNDISLCAACIKKFGGELHAITD